MASNKKIILVHGTGAKPGRNPLLRLWREAMRLGLTRDEPEKVALFDDTPCELFYYADRLEQFQDAGFDADLDIRQRELVLENLGSVAKARDFRRRHYENLPGKSPLKEFALDVGSSVGLGSLLLGKVVPELKHYWKDRDGWASQIRKEFADLMRDELDQGNDILLVSHCLGSVIAYDSLWSIEDRKTRLKMWLTMGSPLASSAVNRRLLGAKSNGAERYPQNILVWHNIAAEDDFMCHDKTVVDDFRGMLDTRSIANITDSTIYNLAVRYGRSNPHHSAGYLVHPRTAGYLADWLDS